MDLEALLVRDPVHTFVLRASGSSMLDAGIAGGERIIADKGLSPTDGDVVLAVVDGQLCVKRFVSTEARHALIPQNPAYRELLITPEMDIRIWGVATICLHELRNWGHS
jgi:DNA polymerase V